MKNVHVVDMSTKKFSDDNLKMTKKYVNPSIWPKHYNNKTLKESFPGLKYVDRRIVNIEDIIYDVGDDMLDQFDSVMRNFILRNRHMIQRARAHGRGINHQDVWSSVRNCGFELCHIPMSICLLPNGKIWLMNGRTRLEVLLECGFTNIIADYYECDNYLSFDKFALWSNPPEKARSPQTMEDVVALGNAEIKLGRLKYSEVTTFVHQVTGGAYATSVTNKIIERINAGDSSTSFSYTAQNALNFMQDNGYHDNINDNGIYYLVVSEKSSASSVPAVGRYLKNLIDDGCKVKELRIVINPGTLQGASAEDSWKKKIDNFRETFQQTLDVIKESYFETYKIDTTIKLYAAIPAVVALAQQYPLDKLVVFEGKLKYKKFSEIDLETGLEKVFGLSD